MRVVMFNEESLNYHLAKKKIPYIDVEGILVKSDEPNGITMKKFVFDMHNFTKNFVVGECLRNEEPARVCAEGTPDFTTTYCRSTLLTIYQKRLRITGTEFMDASSKKAAQMDHCLAKKTNCTNKVMGKSVPPPRPWASHARRRTTARRPSIPRSPRNLQKRGTRTSAAPSWSSSAHRPPLRLPLQRGWLLPRVRLPLRV